MDHKYHFEKIIGHSDAIKRVFVLMEHAIDSDSDILITGETGTGKDLVAKEIHDKSSRKDYPLLSFNCGAISREVLRGELFGHYKGAFTGAIEDKVGLFETAKGGTLILDQIGDMPLEVQANLFSVLEERKVQRLGETTSRAVDVRVIAITNRNLAQQVEVDRFRKDLYYRLNRFHIPLPPLRARLDDIPLLAEHFFKDVCRQISRTLEGFAPDVLELLRRYHWPGNVRELRNAIRRAGAIVEEGSQIQKHHFPPSILNLRIASGIKK